MTSNKSPVASEFSRFVCFISRASFEFFSPTGTHCIAVRSSVSSGRGWMGGGRAGAKSQSRYDTMRLPSGVAERNIHSHINLGLAEQFVVWRLTRRRRRTAAIIVSVSPRCFTQAVCSFRLSEPDSLTYSQQQLQWRLIQSDSDGC